MITSKLLQDLKLDQRKSNLILKKTGHLHDPVSRKKALEILKRGGTIQMIIGDEQAGVGGIFFHIDNPKAAKLVVKLKSTAAKTRQATFALMTPDSYFHQISSLPYQVPLEKLPTTACFLRIPVTDPNQFPDCAVTYNSAGIPIVQCFPSDRVPYFSDFVNEAWNIGMRIGGTSLNFSGQGNITDPVQAASFFVNSKGHKFWFITPARLTGVSYTIIELKHSREAVLHREGSTPYSLITEVLSVNGK